MTTQKELITIQAPKGVFDVDGAVVYRKKRISVAMLDSLLRVESSEAGYQIFARMFPRWDGVIDVDTGGVLPHPEDDPSVFGRIDAIEQLAWFAEQAKAKHPPTLAN